jgi:hypothetical protein
MDQNKRFGLNLKYDQMRGNDPQGQQEGSTENYPGENHVRNVCFVLQDGRMIFLNYAYLVSGEYVPEENAITLTFTSHTVTLTGVHLEPLFYDLMGHLPRRIACTDARYNEIDDEKRTVVNNISVRNHELDS